MALNKRLELTNTSQAVLLALYLLMDRSKDTRE